MRERKKTISDGRRYLFPTILAVIALGLFFAFFPNIDVGNAPPKQTKPLATLLEKRDTKEIGFDEIFDDAPLFITTRWNAAKKPKKINPPDGWDFDKSEDVEYAKDLRSQSFLIDENAYITRGKTSMSRAVMRNAFLGYARKDSPPISSDTRDKVSFSLIDLHTGKTVKSHSFESALSENMFSIAEFKVSIEKDGWVTSPLVSQSSGDEKIDEKLSNMLAPRDLLKGVPSGKYKAIFVP